MRIDVLGVGFDNLTLEEALDKAAEISGGYIVTPNPEIVWDCRKNPEFCEAVKGASLILPDGVGITIGAKILGRPLKGRVPGLDFAMAYMARLAAENKKVFLFGAKPGVAQAAAENLKLRFPGLIICGTADGYFKNDTQIIKAINEAEPDFLTVCLGAPKQELWMRANAGKVSAKLMIGLGGVLDVCAGVGPQTPESWRKAGFEWLYRLIKQPSRIKRQIKLPLYLLAVTARRFKRSGNAEV
jgi:N-acetylglucosaminyldiphosphoundecaprenol N-acetyl-beta-D-mannosaminyltransferase